MARKAFSLLELMIVITIIAILASASFPAFNEVTTRAKMMKSVSNFKQVLTALNLYALDWDGTYPNTDDMGNEFANSTDVFQFLMQETGVNAEEIFFTLSNDPNKQDPPNGDGFLDPRENCLVFVRGMNTTVSSGAPIIADEMESAGTYGQFHPWLAKKKAIVGYVGGQVKTERLNQSTPGATVRGPRGSTIEDIFQPGNRDEQGRITGGMLPAHINPGNILLPQ